MINLSADVLEALEKVARAEEDFITLFKALSVGGAGKIVVPSANMTPIHTNLLLHIIANLVEAQTEILQLKGQLAILKMKGDDNANGTDAKDNQVERNRR